MEFLEEDLQCFDIFIFIGSQNMEREMGVNLIEQFNISNIFFGSK